MTEDDTNELKQSLINLNIALNHLQDQLEKSSGTVALDQSRVGRLSRMDAMQAQQMALAASRRRKQQILKIEGALQRIEADDFGYCFICNEEIDIRRLFADPTNTRCLKCAD